MTSIAEDFDDTSIFRRAAVLLVQLLALYVVSVLAITWGALGIPVILVALFLAVYQFLKQVEGIVDDRLARVDDLDRGDGPGSDGPADRADDSRQPGTGDHESDSDRSI
ncbi:hypothetical protein C475_17298 [Halosimplex carlsbadense 2-9-1]|uniref:Uncharacterized protein n=1 Tax=Halosimplex carlsbadense 2-9-1 TaxID=797114 RepID=M0CG91_9EURY|nr:hypothetical protein [Halosimplex carlsbadense]ELZ22290.1 hypothetical protein C475_17298 [Halosimplex carlsbadense 2-9-1]